MDIISAIQNLLEHDTAGDPITGLKWSRRTTGKIADLLHHYGIRVSANTVARLLHQMDYSLRVNQKKLATDSSPDRDLQFDYIADLRERFRRRHLVGNFKNAGARWDRSPRLVYDHDFRSDSVGVAIPYGLYDPVTNRGSVVVGVSHDTPAFAAHAITHWWQCEGGFGYRGSRQLLILADTGGSNGYRCRAWKTELQTQLADSFHLTVTVAHYPTGTSNAECIVTRSLPLIGRANWSF